MCTSACSGCRICSPCFSGGLRRGTLPVRDRAVGGRWRLQHELRGRHETAAAERGHGERSRSQLLFKVASALYVVSKLYDSLHIASSTRSPCFSRCAGRADGADVPVDLASERWQGHLAGLFRPWRGADGRYSIAFLAAATMVYQQTASRFPVAKRQSGQTSDGMRARSNNSQ